MKNQILNLLLGKEHRDFFVIIYSIIIISAFLYFTGHAIGQAFNYYFN